MTEETEIIIYQGSAKGDYMPGNFVKRVAALGHDVEPLPETKEVGEREGTKYLSRETLRWQIGGCMITQTTEYRLSWRREISTVGTEIKACGPKGELEQIVRKLDGL